MVGGGDRETVKKEDRFGGREEEQMLNGEVD